jgi:hypothetical protein
MDERGIYDNSGTNQNQPTTAESGTSQEGANKRDPLSASPTMGDTIAGRDVQGDSTVGGPGSVHDHEEAPEQPQRNA